MKRLFIITMVLFSVGLQGQTKDEVAKEVNDTTLYFYGSFELASGLNVLTETDTLTVDKANLVSTTAALRAMNQTRLLKFAMAQMGEKRLNLKNPNAPVVQIFTTREEMDETLNTLLYTKKNSIYRLVDFKFNKDVELGKGPGNPIIK